MQAGGERVGGEGRGEGGGKSGGGAAGGGRDRRVQPVMAVCRDGARPRSPVPAVDGTDGDRSGPLRFRARADGSAPAPAFKFAPDPVELRREGAAAAAGLRPLGSRVVGGRGLCVRAATQFTCLIEDFNKLAR